MRSWLALSLAAVASTFAMGARAQAPYEPPPAAPYPPAANAPPHYAEAPAPRFASRLDPSKEGFSLGFDLMRLQDDFGVGASASSPILLHWLRFTTAGGVAWYPHGLTSSGTETWDPLGHARLVVEVGPTFQKGIPVRPYGFGGGSLLVLPTSLSNNQLRFGGVGGFGVELAFMYGERSGPVTYYMEVGGCGYGASAEKLPTNPDVASGLLLNAGFRAYL